VALITLHQDANAVTQSTETHYLYKDHLGSLDLITGASGAITDELSFDAWGQRRSGINWHDIDVNQLIADYGVFSSLAPPTTRGFTGHEMAGEVGVIHMNGRIYDPRLGRFLQADPFVQSPADSQMYNRYSYTRNNPLNATDPSGYLLPLIAGAIAWAAGVEVATIAIVVGVASFTQSLVMGAPIGDAFLAGISAFALSYAGITLFPGLDAGFGEFLTYGVQMGTVGGITSTLQGGNFGHGFIGAGLGSMLGGYIAGMDWFQGLQFTGQLVTKAIIGGTVSEASGGKFANGAGSSAFNVTFSSVVGNTAGQRASNIRTPSPNAELGAKLEQKMMTELSSNEVIDDAVTAESTFPAYSARSTRIPEIVVFSRAAVASGYGGINAAYESVSSTITATGFTSRARSRGFSPGASDVGLAVGLKAARNFQQAAIIASGAPVLIAGGTMVGGAAGAFSVAGAMTADIALRNHIGKSLSAGSTLISGSVSVGMVGASTSLSAISGGSLAAKWAWTSRTELAGFVAGNGLSTAAGY
jgi:RHS repeat-associated protein